MDPSPGDGASGDGSAAFEARLRTEFDRAETLALRGEDVLSGLRQRIEALERMSEEASDPVGAGPDGESSDEDEWWEMERHEVSEMLRDLMWAKRGLDAVMLKLENGLRQARGGRSF